jgi:glycosyltransferase involved in cell wall biosynthesis
VKKRVLFIGALPTVKAHHDGERNKSGACLESFLLHKEYAVDVIDYSKNKYLQSLKLIIKVALRKYSSIFLIKPVGGGSFALHLIFTFANKANRKNVTYYCVGNGFEWMGERDSYKKYLSAFVKCKNIIIESPMVSRQFEERGLHPNLVFPVVKKGYDLPVLEKVYSGEEPLDIIFFSRVIEQKGVLDAIDVILKINREHGKTLFTFDISGAIRDTPEGKKFLSQILDTIKGYPEIKYIGTTISSDSVESYKKIQQYDLHLFPTRYECECAPGSVVDMFIAGVPTLSSRFESAHFMMNEENSYFFELGNKDDMEKQLMHIYLHKRELNGKRKLCRLEFGKYSIQAFAEFMSKHGII